MRKLCAFTIGSSKHFSAHAGTTTIKGTVQKALCCIKALGFTPGKDTTATIFFPDGTMAAFIHYYNGDKWNVQYYNE